MHTAIGRSKEQVAVLAIGRYVMRMLAALLGALFSAAVLVLLGFAGAYQFIAPEIPEAAALREVKSQLPLRVVSQDGKLIAQIGEQRRIPVGWEQIHAWANKERKMSAELDQMLAELMKLSEATK